MTKHSPLPWHAEGCELVAADGYTVGSIAGVNPEEDALNIALIVKAVNYLRLTPASEGPVVIRRARSSPRLTQV